MRCFAEANKVRSLILGYGILSLISLVSCAPIATNSETQRATVGVESALTSTSEIQQAKRRNDQSLDCNAITHFSKYLFDNAPNAEHAPREAEISRELMASAAGYQALCRHALGAEAASVTKPDQVVADLKIISQTMPVHFDTVAFQCIGDYESCSALYKQRDDKMDQIIACGTAVFICLGSLLIHGS